MGSVGNNSNGFLSKSQQLNVILQANPAEDGVHTWIREESDILTFQEVWQDGPYDIDPDFTAEDVQRVLDTGIVTIYSSKPLVNGNFISPSAMEAAAYSGDGTIYTATVNVKDIAWIDESQGQIATNNIIRYKRISSKGLI